MGAMTWRGMSGSGVQDWYDEERKILACSVAVPGNMTPGDLRVSYRDRYGADFRNGSIGFRLVQDIP